MSYEQELVETSRATGAPYAELLCLTRSLGQGRSLRVDAEARAFVLERVDGASKVWPFGWLDAVGEGGGE